MNFKQAQVELRAMVRVFRAFEHVDEILKAASASIQAQVNAEEKLVELLGEIAGVETNLVAGRERATAEQGAARVELEHLRKRHFDTEAKFKTLAEETRSTRERVANENRTAMELQVEELRAEYKKVTTQKDEQEKLLSTAQDEYAAMLKRLGVTAPSSGPEGSKP